MRKWKYVILIGLAPLLMALAAFVCLLLWPEKPSVITPEKARKIQPGMSLEEVETILGGPARFDYDGPVTNEGVSIADKVDRQALAQLNRPKPPNSVRELRWGSGTVTVYVHFDAAGKSLPVRYLLHSPAPETLLEWVRRKLHA
jgi:hypothetical protein